MVAPEPVLVPDTQEIRDLRKIIRLEQEVKTMEQFVQDCAKSHKETIHKFRAQVILAMFERDRP